MEKENLNITDESGDKKYFTIIPNYILNHSTHWDREVYIQMKRVAGENGTCWMSLTKLSKQCGISRNRLLKSLSYLKEHHWIDLVGAKSIETKGGLQRVNQYSINDLWKINSSFYEKKGSLQGKLPYEEGSLQKVVCRINTKKNLTKEELNNKESAQSCAQEISKEWTYQDKWKELIDSDKLLNRIIAVFWKKKGFIFDNSKQFSSRYRRDCRTAKKIAESGYSEKQLINTFDFVADKYGDINWTLETIEKSLAETNK